MSTNLCGDLGNSVGVRLMAGFGAYLTDCEPRMLGDAELVLPDLFGARTGDDMDYNFLRGFDADGLPVLECEHPSNPYLAGDITSFEVQRWYVVRPRKN